MSGFKFLSVVLLVTQVLSLNSYEFPEVTVQALKNGDFRVFIPDSKGVTSFAAHAKVNEKIGYLEEGTFFLQVEKKSGDSWIAAFNNGNVKVGDTIYLWASVVVENFNYIKTDINVTISELYNSYPKLQTTCVISSTSVDGGKQVCAGDLIINEEFQGPKIDTSKWIVEHWIPTYTPPCHIFNSYQNRDDTRFIRNNILYLKPIPVLSKYDLRGPLDLTSGCTSNVQSECYLKTRAATLLPAVRSAKITSRISFKYGKVDIRAKLPAGEWIFPVIQLEQKVKQNGENSSKIIIAYSRGNDELKGNNGNDIGSRVLFGGPVPHPFEPIRSQYLSTTRAPNPFYSDFHIYSFQWQADKMTFMVDNVQYGSINLAGSFIDDIDIRGGTTKVPIQYQTEYVLTLGTSVGGLLDFPDGYSSGSHAKPWGNKEGGFISKFYEKKTDWGTSWRGDDVALQVDYVKVYAL